MSKLPESDNVIRASRLDGYNDCALKSAVDSWPKLFTSLGYTLKFHRTNISAAVGTGVHAAVAHAFQIKLEHERTPDLKEAIEAGVNEFEEEIKEGCDFDVVTPNTNDAATQINKLTRSYYGTIGHTVQPSIVEKRFEADLTLLQKKMFDEPIHLYKLSGQPDHVLDDGSLGDLKTGRKLKAYPGQLGAYNALLKANGIKPTTAKITFLRRLPANKDPERPVVQEYKLDDAEKIAYMTIKRIIIDRTKFDTTQNPLSFPINPASILCSPRYCRAYGSEICPGWRMKEANK